MKTKRKHREDTCGVIPIRNLNKTLYGKLIQESRARKEPVGETLNWLLRNHFRGTRANREPLELVAEAVSLLHKAIYFKLEN